MTRNIFDEFSPRINDSVPEFDPTSDVNLACTDTLRFLESVPDGTYSLIVTSPPYNIGKEYEVNLGLDKYLTWHETIIGECVRVLQPNGNICWQVGNFIENGEVFPLDIYFYNIFKKKYNLKLRNRIIWHFGHGLHAKKRFSGRYETILWFSQNDNYIFNLDSVRVPSKYPGKRHYKGEHRGELSGNPNGKNPSDFWQIIERDFDSLLWNIPNVKSNHPEKTLHPCQFPIELVQRLVLAFSRENDRVFDPFVGSGSTLIAALMHNRKVDGVDKEQIYIDIAASRLREFIAGTLKIRPIGKPIFEPTGREQVAKMPDEWAGNYNENR